MNIRHEIIFSALVVAVMSAMKLADATTLSWVWVLTSFMWYYVGVGVMALLWLLMNLVAELVHKVGF
jgi:hypothetical protein